MSLMKDEYLIGIKQIDEEHTKLFEIAEEAIDLLNNQFIPDKYDHFIEIINQLIAYSKSHFAHEEEYMEKIQYKRLFSQKMEHKKFILMLEMLDPKQLDNNEDDSLAKEVERLVQWLIDHIIQRDKLIKEA